MHSLDFLSDEIILFKNYRKLDDSGENEASEVENDVKLTNDGPLPWCQAGDLVFVAEQVSHHPPISAFYCEHVKKRVKSYKNGWYGKGCSTDDNWLSFITERFYEEPR